LRLLGSTAAARWCRRFYAKHLFRCLGTVQAEPVAVGTGGNALEMISFSGRTLPTCRRPAQAAVDGHGDPTRWSSWRAMRDTTLDQLNALFKTDGTPSNAASWTPLASSQQQVRLLSQSLSTTLASITTNDVHGQALAAAALIARQGRAGGHAAHPVRRATTTPTPPGRRGLRPHDLTTAAGARARHPGGSWTRSRRWARDHGHLRPP